MNDPFNDRIDEQGHLRLEAWRCASRCPTCGTVVDARIGSMAADAQVRLDRTHQQPARRGTHAYAGAI